LDGIRAAVYAFAERVPSVLIREGMVGGYRALPRLSPGPLPRGPNLPVKLPLSVRISSGIP